MSSVGILNKTKTINKMKPKQYNKKQLEAVSNILNLYGEDKAVEIFGAATIIENKGMKIFLEDYSKFEGKKLSQKKKIELKLMVARYYVLYLEGGLGIL